MTPPPDRMIAGRSARKAGRSGGGVIGTLTLSPSIDRELLVDELVKDDAVRARRVLDTAGGKGVNVSKVVRELGGRTVAFAPCGGFGGRLYAQKVRLLDFPCRLVPVAGETRLNIILTDRDDATQTRISAPSPRLTRVEMKRFLNAVLALRPRPFAWVLGGTLPSGADPRTYFRIIRLLQRATGSPCVLDTDDEALRWGVRAKPFMIKPNEFELERLMGKKIRGLSSYARAAVDLTREGVRIAVVSLGPKGAVFASDGRAFFIPGLPVRVRSKVGAGDSLIGGLLLGLERGRSLEDAARLGMAASHSAVMREAPRLCRRSDIPRLAGRFHIRRLI